MSDVSSSFSVYQYIEHTAPENIFSDKRQMLAYWCMSIENELIEQSIPLTLFAGFQQLDYFLPVIERYQMIAEKSDEIFVFGEPASQKIMPIPKVNYVHLSPDDQLCNEWFLIAHNEHYSRAIIAFEVTPPNTPHADRVFNGVLTNDVNIIYPAYEALMEQVRTMS